NMDTVPSRKAFDPLGRGYYRHAERERFQHLDLHAAAALGRIEEHGRAFEVWLNLWHVLRYLDSGLRQLTAEGKPRIPADDQEPGVGNSLPNRRKEPGQQPYRSGMSGIPIHRSDEADHWLNWSSRRRNERIERQVQA